MPSASSTSQPFSPTGQHKQRNFYASSAPSSSIALPNQQSPRNRPPVPLFTSNSTGNMRHQQASRPISTMDSSDGISPSTTSYDSSDELTWCNIATTRETYSFSLDDYISRDGSSSDFPLFDSQESEVAFLSSAFEPINTPDSAHGPSNTQTVSPQDLFLDNMSAPPSSAITNLSTPGTYSMESPFVAMSNDTSPVFGTSSMYSDDLLDEDTKEWGSLFLTESTILNENDFVHESEYQNVDMTAPPPMSRNQSSPGQSSSRGSHQGRHSSSSGVNAKKRDKPLPPIIVDDPSDVIAVKRARNTAAARKSRQKKMERFDELEATIADLQGQVDHWKRIALARNDS